MNATPLADTSFLTVVIVAVAAIVGFAVVVGVTAVVMALLQAVLPGVDTDAEEVHRRELERHADGSPDPAPAAGAPAVEEEPGLSR